MDRDDQFFQFYKPYLQKIASTIKTGKVLIIVGINAIGKSLLAEQIFTPTFRQEFLPQTKTHLVLLSFKDTVAPTKEQLYAYWLDQTCAALKLKQVKGEINDFSFYSHLSEITKRMGEDEKIAFVLLDAQNLLSQNEAFFQTLIYLSIYSYNKISYIFLSEPHILSSKNPGLQKLCQRFTRHTFTFLHPFDRKTALADIRSQERLLKSDFSAYEKLILKYSHGLHGVIRTFCYLLRDNPEVRNISRLMKIAYSDKLCRFWVHEVLTSLPFESVQILKEVSVDKKTFSKYRNNLFGKWLVDLGFLKNNGALRHPFILPILQEFMTSNEKGNGIRKVKNGYIVNGENVNLSKNETAVLDVLYKERGKIVSFDKLGEALWKNEPDRFSLWAIAQIIRRLKKRLATYFINPHVIKSVRGKGYVLN